jgi:DNA primase
MSQWIDFKALRESLDFAAVLRHYNVELKQKKGDQYQTFCPLPGHQGSRRSPSFSAHVERRIFQCFGCGARGNVLDFVVLMEGKDLRNTQQVREVAQMLQERFAVPTAVNDERRPAPPASAQRRAGPPAKPVAKTPHQTLINPPLDFELRGLDFDHPYLYERGFTRKTVERFGLGFCSRARYAGRLAIPLHNPEGQLVGYAGRLTKDGEISEKNPKYLFPCDRIRNDVVHEFRKSVLLYNAHTITKPVSDLVVVEGFASVWWLWQLGFFNCVAIMGSSCSEDQGRLIAKLIEPRYANVPASGGRAWVLTDGDPAGQRCASSIFEQVSMARSVRWPRLAKDQQPTDLSAEQLLKVLEVT